MVKHVTSGALILALLGLSGCRFSGKAHYYAEDKKTALAALSVFHRHLSEGDFDAILENSAGAFAEIPRDLRVGYLRDVRESFGRVVSSEVKSYSCFPGEVRLMVESQFEKSIVSEMVAWRVDAEKPGLAGFRAWPGPLPAHHSNGANWCNERPPGATGRRTMQ